MSGKRTSLLGLALDDLSPAAAVALLLARPPDAAFGYVVTPNADHFARLRRQPALRPLYEEALLCLLDSQLLGGAARRLGLRPPAVVTGVALTAGLLTRLDGHAAAIIGMTDAEFAALQARYPAIAFRRHAAPMGLLHDAAGLAAACDFAITTRAGFTFIALGSPLQEMLANAVKASGQACGVGLCIGAALQFCAGRRRAPLWMRQAGLEWLHRLAAEPRRLGRRYLWDDPPVLAALCREAWRRRRA